MLQFKADLTIRTYDKSQTASEIALCFGQGESHRLIRAWEHISPYFVHVDFNVVWKKFLKDYEAVINDSKTAEAVLLEIDMSEKLATLKRESQKSMPIDDSLLLHSFLSTKKASAEKEEMGEGMLASFAEHVPKQPPKPWDTEKWGEYVRQVKQEEAEKEGKSIMVIPSRRVIAKSRHPEKDLPPTQPREYNLIDTLSEVTGVIPFVADDKEDSKEIEDEDSSQPSVDNYRPISASDKKKDPSHIDLRRKSLARKTALDAKFMKFTRRLSNQSALGLSIRAPEAPLRGTEEVNIT